MYNFQNTTWEKINYGDPYQQNPLNRANSYCCGPSPNYWSIANDVIIIFFFSILPFHVRWCCDAKDLPRFNLGLWLTKDPRPKIRVYKSCQQMFSERIKNRGLRMQENIYNWLIDPRKMEITRLWDWKMTRKRTMGRSSKVSVVFLRCSW